MKRSVVCCFCGDGMSESRSATLVVDPAAGCLRESLSPVVPLHPDLIPDQEGR